MEHVKHNIKQCYYKLWKKRASEEAILVGLSKKSKKLG